MSRSRTAWWLASVPLVFLGLFFFYPLVSILSTGLGMAGEEGVGNVFGSTYIAELFAFTAGQALISTALSLLIGIPTSYVLGSFRFRGRGVFLALATLPFVLPTVVVAAALLAVVGQNGLINSALRSLWGPEAPVLVLERTLSLVILAHVFYNTPVVLRILITHWMTRDRRAEEAAQLLGASPLSLWWRIRLRLALPSILSAALLVFIFTFTSFGVVLLLGGSRIATVEVEIYRQTVGLFNLPVAAALSLLQMVFMTVLIAVFSILDGRVAATSGPPELRSPRGGKERAAAIVTVVGLGLLLIVPLLLLVLQSVSGPDHTLTLRAYELLAETSRQSVLSEPALKSLFQSLLIAVAAVSLAIPLGTLTATAMWMGKGRGHAALNLAVLLPLSASAVLLGLGFVIALDEPPLNLRSSWVLLPIAHTLVAIPLIVRTLTPSLRALPLDVREAALVLGAPPRTVWRRVIFPLLRPALVVGALFAFTVSMGEFGATLFIARPEWTTAPIAIYRLLGKPGGSNYQQALALSTVLLIACALAFLLMERLRGERPGGI
ncbi:MAG: iron ABC transporter permease [Anaerolineae bacterium]